MRILHSKTPAFYFNTDTLEMVSAGSGGIEKMMQIHSVISFARFMEEVEIKFDCIVLLEGFQSFLHFPQPDGPEYWMIRYWGHYKQEYLNLFQLK